MVWGELRKDSQRTPEMRRRRISHDEATEALRRFENMFWKREPGPRVSIPAHFTTLGRGGNRPLETAHYRFNVGVRQVSTFRKCLAPFHTSP